MEVTMAGFEDTFREGTGFSGTEGGGVEESDNPNCEIYVPCDLVAMEEQTGLCEEMRFAQALSGEIAYT
jgi:hypothetical protein